MEEKRINKIKKLFNKKTTIFALLIAFVLVAIVQAVRLTSHAEPIDDENWELGLVFYDSTVDNGQTPLTEINWDASDGGYGEGEPRTITVQINYKNTNVVKSYDKNEVVINFDNLFSSNYYNLDIDYSVNIGANDYTHTGYDWNFKSNTSASTYTFTNNVRIEEHSNLEGSIQLIYTIKPVSINRGASSNSYVPQYDDETIREHQKNIVASINNSVFSNQLEFSYYRKYVHPWQKKKYHLSKIASKVSFYDGLGERADEYYWVKYNFGNIVQGNDNTSSYPYITARNIRIVDVIPSECIVYDSRLNRLDIVDGIVKPGFSFPIIVGYPKSIYNTDNNNLTITNVAKALGVYKNEETETVLSTDSITINLEEYDVEYSGTTNVFTKTATSKTLEYQSISKGFEYDYPTFSIGNRYDNPLAVYNGRPITVKIGDDFLFATDNNGDFTKLNDTDYWFSSISLPSFNNNNGFPITDSIELWIRKAGNNYYEQYEYSNKNIVFNDDIKVVGYYILLKDLTQGVSSKYNLESTLKFYKEDIPETGYLVNVAYLQVYERDNNGNLVLQNKKEGSSQFNGLNTSLSRSVYEQISNYDYNEFGAYIQRYYDSYRWVKRSFSKLVPTVNGSKGNSPIIQDASNELFGFDYRVVASISSNPSLIGGIEGNYFDDYFDLWTDEELISKVIIEDTLPLGVELISTSIEKPILSGTPHIYYSNKQRINASELEYDYKYEYVKNKDNSGRDYFRIEIIFDKPFYISGNRTYLSIKSLVNVKVSYDSYLLYGKTYRNEAEVKLITVDENVKTSQATATTTINSVISTHQDVTKYVETDQDAFTQTEASSSLDTPYRYRLRVRTGENDITNLVIYDSIEEYAKMPDGSMQMADGDKGSWDGTFQGVDTSPAELKGYTVKVYYNENTNPGTLKEDTTWKEYNDSIDKSKVKSLAFEYLDSEGNPAILPKNSVTFVHVLMKSPEKKKRYNYTYNGCYTQWNAIDSITGDPVDFITGINSNIVKVKLEEIEPVTIKKTNSEGIRLGEVVFRLVNSIIDEVLVTSSEQDILIKLEDGEYELIENETVEGFKKLEGKISFVVENGKITSIIKEAGDKVYVLEEGKVLLIENEILSGQINIPVEKVWSGGILSESVDAILLNKEQEVQRVTLTRENNYQGEFENVEKYDAQGIEIDYTVKEEFNYEAKANETIETSVDYSGDESGFIIKNVSSIKIPLKVEKKWVGKPLEKVTIYLYKNDEKTDYSIELNEANGYTSSFEGLEKYDEENNLIEYSIKEVAIEGYESHMEKTEDGFIITNTKIEEEVPQEEEPTKEEPKKSQEFKGTTKEERVKTPLTLDKVLTYTEISILSLIISFIMMMWVRKLKR